MNLNQWFFYNDARTGHAKSLDGLRGIAVLFVLLSHASFHGMYFFPSLSFNGIGKGGVYLFYVLSAYLLDRQIAFALMNHNASKKFWIRYFIRRVLRIFPLFTVALFVFLFLSKSGIPTSIEKVEILLRHLLLLEGNGVFWSIPVEFKYYIISPLILLVCSRMLKWNLVRILIFFILIAIFSVGLDYYLHFDRISTIKYILVFLTGTYLAIHELQSEQTGFRNKYARLAGIIAFAALLFSMIMNPNYLGHWMGIDTSNNGRKVMIMYAFLCGVMLFAALRSKGIFQRILLWKPLRFLGIISFSVYLFHMPVIYVIESGVISIYPAGKIYFFFLATILVSSVTFLSIERPLSGLKLSFLSKHADNRVV